MPRRTSSSVGSGFAVEQRDGGENLPGRAEAALERVVLDERRLHGCSASVAPDALDRRDGLVRARRGEREAGVHRHDRRAARCRRRIRLDRTTSFVPVSSSRSRSVARSVSCAGAVTSCAAPLTMRRMQLS